MNKRIKKINCKCKICGKIFYLLPCRIRLGRGTLCSSKKCLSKYLSITRMGANNPAFGKKKSKKWYVVMKNRTGKNNAWYGKKHTKKTRKHLSKVHTGKIGELASNWQGGKVTIFCKLCFKEFKLWRYKAKKKRNRFCSKSCSSIWNKLHMPIKDTLIERLIEQELKLRRYEFKKQVPVKGISVVDFLLPNKDIIIFCDGSYWHSSEKVKRSDYLKTRKLRQLGFKVFRFSEGSIKKDPAKCIDKIFKGVEVVAVSGGFDCLHLGHLFYLKKAAQLGEKLIVILNTDNFLLRKKGYVFMQFSERKNILENIKCVDFVIQCIDKDQSVRKTLCLLKPDIFVKGGDRTLDNIPEREICEKLNIEMLFNVGGKKIQSSSEIINKYIIRNENKN